MSSSKRLQEISKTLADISKYATKKPKISPYVKEKSFGYPFDIPKKVVKDPSEAIVKVYRGKDGRDGRSIVGPQGERGFPGRDGRDGQDGKDGRDGKDGKTPVAGIDFQIPAEETPESLAQKINMLDGKIKPSAIEGYVQEEKDEEEEDKKEEAILKSIKSVLTSKDFQIEPKHIKGMPLNFNDMRWHGSGVPSLTAGTNITLTLNTDGGYTISSSISGSGYQVPTGSVNGSNQSFVFTVAPNVICVDGVTMNQTQADGTINWTGTTNVTMTVAPNFNIFSIN